MGLICFSLLQHPADGFDVEFSHQQMNAAGRFWIKNADHLNGRNIRLRSSLNDSIGFEFWVTSGEVVLGFSVEEYVGQRWIKIMFLHVLSRLIQIIYTRWPFSKPQHFNFDDNQSRHDVQYTLMDCLTQAGFKSLQVEFHNILKWMKPLAAWKEGGKKTF